MRLLFVLLCWLTTAGLALLSAQEVAAVQFAPARDLPFSTVYGQIIQDSLDYIWLGTDKGLYRYDGQHFRLSPIDNRINAVEVLGLRMDSKGQLWYLNLAGQVCTMQTRADTVRYFNPSNLLEKMHIDNFFLNGDHSQFFCSAKLRNKTEGESQAQRLLYSIALETGAPAELIEEDFGQKAGFDICSFNESMIYRIKKGDQYQLWEHSSAGERHILDLGEEGSANHFSFRKIGEDHLFISINDGDWNLYKIELTDSMQTVQLPNIDIGGITNMLADVEGDFWVTSNNGFFRVDRDLPLVADDHLFLKGKVVHNLLIDREGSYWAGTRNEGLFFLPSLSSFHYTSTNSFLNHNEIRGLIHGPDSSLLIATSDGHLYMIRGEEVVWSDFAPSGKNRNAFISDMNYLGDKLLVSVNTENFIIYELEGRKFRKGAIDFRRKAAKKAVMTKPGTAIVVGSSSQTSSYRIVGNEVQREARITGRNTALLRDRYLPYIWIGEPYALRYYNYEAKTFHTIQDGASSFDQFVVDISQSADSVIWISTPSDGVYGLKGDSLWYHLRTSDGLLSNNCTQLYADAYNQLWVGAEKGITKVDLSSFEMSYVDQTDGLTTEVVNALCRVGDHLWVGTNDGLFRIEVSKLRTNLSPPKVLFSQIKIWDKDTTLAKAYNLPHHQNNFQISYHSNRFRGRERSRYRYRMLGIDTSWEESSSNFVRYPQLSPGDYRFEVKAVNEDGIESLLPAVISFHLRAPYWQTWWFISLIVLGIVLLTGGLVQWRGRRRRQQRERELHLENRIEKLKARALRSQMNPHFIFNTLNSILYFLIQNDRKSSLRFLARFSRLIRYIFEHSKHDKISIAEEIQFLDIYLSLEKLRFKDKIDITFQIDEELKTSTMAIPPLLVQPIIENSFKHGLFHKKAGGKLIVNIQKQADGIEVLIEDNGVGRKQSAAINREKGVERSNTSTGIIQERIDLINSHHNSEDAKIEMDVVDLSDERGAPTGTRTVISFVFLKP